MLHRLLDAVMRRRADALAARLAPHLRAGSWVVDVGAGTGHNADALVRRAACARVTPVDVVDMRVVGPAVVLMQGHELPFPEKSFDFALLLYVLHYTLSPVEMLRACARVSRGGVLVVQSTHDDEVGRALLRANELAWGPLAWGVARAARWVPPGGFSLGARRLMSEREMQAAVAEAGLQVAQREGAPWRAGHVRSDLWVLR